MSDIEKLKTLAMFAERERSKWESDGRPWPQPTVCAFEMMAAIPPQALLELICQLQGYQQGADVEAQAADEARKEAKRLKGLLHMIVTQAMPLEDIPDLPGYSRVVDANRLVAENEALRKDAERLDWLGGTFGSIDIVLDQIDAAMALEKQA